jgi:ABC-type transport system substrate-binding protein
VTRPVPAINSNSSPGVFGASALDSAKRSQIYKGVQRMLVQKVYVIPLYLEPNIALTSSIIGNYVTNPTLLGNAWNIGDWYRIH